MFDSTLHSTELYSQSLNIPAVLSRQIEKCSSKVSEYPGTSYFSAVDLVLSERRLHSLGFVKNTDEGGLGN